MDSFTETILARARERQRLLKDYTTSTSSEKQDKGADFVGNEVGHTSPTRTNYPNFDKKNFGSRTPERTESSISPQQILPGRTSEGSPSNSPKTNTLNIQRDNLNMEIKVTSSDNVRLQVEIEENSSDDDDDGQNDNNQHNKDTGLRKDAKDRLNRLGKLYAGGDDADISSPIHRTEENFCNDTCDKMKGEPKRKVMGKGLRGLANLADQINHFEDDIKPKNADEEQNSVQTRPKKPPAPKPPTQRPMRPSMVPGSPIKDRINRLNNIASAKPNTSPKKEIFNKQVIEVQEETIPKALKWDRAVLDSLESQGFERKRSVDKLVYDYNSDKESQAKDTKNLRNSEKELKENKSPRGKPFGAPLIKSSSRTAIADKAARFEPPQTRTASPDPSSLSITERKALFEKNRGEALVPKAPFGMAIPINEKKNYHKLPSGGNASNSNSAKTSNSYQQQETGNTKQAVGAFTDSESKNRTASSSKSPGKKYPAPQPPRANSTSSSSNSPVKAAVPQAGGIASTMAALLQKKNTISQAQIENEVKEQRKKELDVLLNRFNRNKELQKTVIEEQEELDESDESSSSETTPMMSQFGTAPSAPVMSEEEESPNYKRRSGSKRHSVSPKVAAVLEDVKRIKVSPTKPGRLYPNLSDIEASTETENEDRTQSPTPNNSSIESNCEDDPNTSFGREIMEAVCKHETPKKRVSYDNYDSDISDVLDDMDDYLDEALAYDEERKNGGPTPPKQIKSQDYSQSSHSFNYKNFKSPMKVNNSPKKTAELPTHVVDGEEVLPLTHTVSFYRKQTNTPTPSPMKQLTRTPERLSLNEDNKNIILAKIKSLQDEVNKQQLMIAQTSQALNLCNSTLEFMGSTEQVEAEKVLLLSTHRRQAILNEIQRLKVEGTLRPQSKHAKDLPLEKGSLTITNITLPLKRDYVRALAAAGGKGHHVTCLVKCGEEVVCSKLVSTVASDIKNPCCELSIPGTITLKNIYSDFAITFEVYCLQAQEEILPHEVKYHIKKNNKATPKKSKHDSLLSRPIKESPAGPQAVRSPSFAQMGYVVFSVQQMNKKTWSLNNTPTMSPLEGSVEMNISCELTTSVEQHGFLTMFEDISGFGAWHRRWCLLKENTLSYWKYPDDEKKTPPIDTIDLKMCITQEVGPVSRDICARLHTFLLETVRDPIPQDKDTLITICKKDKTIIRHLLSADTKEERIVWCTKLNAALTALKLWGKCT